jgi:hypothetical protein
MAVFDLSRFVLCGFPFASHCISSKWRVRRAFATRPCPCPCPCRGLPPIYRATTARARP